MYALVNSGKIPLSVELFLILTMLSANGPPETAAPKIILSPTLLLILAVLPPTATESEVLISTTRSLLSPTVNPVSPNVIASDFNLY